MPEHSLGRICGLLDALLRRNFLLAEPHELVELSFASLPQRLEKLTLSGMNGLLDLGYELGVFGTLGLPPHPFVLSVLSK